MFKKKEKTELSVQNVSQTSFKVIWSELKRNNRAMIGLSFIVLIVLAALLADVISPFGMTEQNLANALHKPSLTHLMGTDDLGRDVFSRIIYGSRVSLTIGLSAVAIALTIGGILGLIAGYYSGKFDSLIMRLSDILLSIPSTLLAIAIVASFGSSLTNLILAIGISNIPIYARVVRSAVLSIREKQFLEASNALGVSDFKIIVRHILPNILSPVIVQATMGIASAILSAAGLGFIGLGIEASVAEWGTMLSYGRQYIRTHAFLTIFPGLAIMLTILSFNLLGDGIRDALDPKLRD